MGTHLIELSESYLMNTNMTGFRYFSKNLCIIVLWMKVASALEGLSMFVFMVNCIQLLFGVLKISLYSLAAGYLCCFIFAHPSTQIIYLLL